jgi:uncharacterized protein
MTYWQALLIGIFGSFHCIGMCGPLALALPLKENTWFTRVSSSLLYNTGRLITYTAMGYIFGILGFGLNLWGFQQVVSIALGAIMILSVLFPLFFRKFSIEARIGRWFTGIKNLFGRFFALRTYGSVFMIGILNGLLPCGLVYMALAGAVLADTPSSGAYYMFLFGLGTVPAMLAVSLLGNAVSINLRKHIRRIIPVLIILIGLLFIVRGLNLGIPYVSPKMEQTHKPRCCH